MVVFLTQMQSKNITQHINMHVVIHYVKCHKEHTTHKNHIFHSYPHKKADLS